MNGKLKTDNIRRALIDKPELFGRRVDIILRREAHAKTLTTTPAPPNYADIGMAGMKRTRSGHVKPSDTTQPPSTVPTSPCAQAQIIPSKSSKSQKATQNSAAPSQKPSQTSEPSNAAQQAPSRKRDQKRQKLPKLPQSPSVPPSSYHQI
jgi:hypothetical protein